MTKTFDIELIVRPDSAAEADDTAGHGLQAGATTQVQGLLFRLAPGAAIRLTLPDPAPIDTKRLDVKGFLSDAAPVAGGQEDEDVEGHLWMIVSVVVGGFFVGYGGVSFYRDVIETESVPKNPKGGNYNP